jgi:transcriptional regulator with XRE-family HTH domain
VPTTLAERIAWILRARDISARQLGLQAGLSHTYVGLILQGRRTNLTGVTAAKLAATAKVDQHWLLTGEGQPEPGVVVDALPGADTPALVQALALLGERLSPPVKTALRAERPGAAWTVEQWIERGLHLQSVYDKLPQD